MKEQQQEVIQSAYEYLPRFKQGISELAQQIKINTTSKERETITQVIDGIQWLLEVFKLTKEIQKTPIQVTDITPLLQEMSEALENDDMVLLGDLLEYELLPLADQWEKQLEQSLR